VLAKEAAGLVVLSNGLNGGSLKVIMHEMDVRKAQATMEFDRERILGEIDASVG
jgi:hypothetical protein